MIAIEIVPAETLSYDEIIDGFSAGKTRKNIFQLLWEFKVFELFTADIHVVLHKI